MAESGGLTRSLALLSVFARGPNTQAGAQAVLTAWEGAGWERNIAHKHVPALVRTGHLRLVARGSKEPFHRYEITEQGERRRRSRLYARARALAAVRQDAWLAKLELCQTRDEVLVVIALCEEEEKMFDDAYAVAHARSMKARRARMRSPELDDDSTQLQSGLREIGIRGEAKLWRETADRLRWMRRELQALLAELQ